MAAEYTSFVLNWQEREITVSFEANWLNSGQWHIELRCDEALPVTSTGYRSLFVPNDEIVDDAAVSAFVIHWLDNAAIDRAWLR